MARSRRVAGFSGLQVLGIVALTIALTAGLTWWIARTYLWPTAFEPVMLSESEQVRLDSKLRALGIDPSASGAASHPTPPPAVSARRPAPARDETPSEWLRPEPYAESGATREVGLTERELNALLARDPDLAERLAIDLSDDLASARLLVPLDPDFPILGGRTLRIAAGLGLSYSEGRPVVILRGVSLMGVPIPNAWLGNLKNVDLVREFGGGEGFWKTLAQGIEDVRVRDGELTIHLRE
ncbi:MAG TPA: arginine N-succinyltransferase [Deltaproteobacteria bacterium]|nr:arginine N-succinyltransferase [Deltaproteobacteria bacterium]